LLLITLEVDVGNQDPVDKGADVIAFCDDAKVIPLPFLEHAFLLREPTAEADGVDSARDLAVDFDLVTLGFSLRALAAEGETGIKTLFPGEEDFKFGLKIGHFDLGGDPDICLRKEVELAVDCFELLDLGARSPAIGRFTVEEVHPFGVGRKESDQEEKENLHQANPLYFRRKSDLGIELSHSSLDQVAGVRHFFKKTMLTFLHAADLHLDSPLRGLSRHEDAPVEAIRGATRRALINLVDLALEKQVNFVLIAGDLYDGDQKDYATALFFNQQMSRLKEGAIPVFAISGNHDAASVISKSLSPPDNVRFLSVKKPETVPVTELPVVIHGQGFATASVPQNLTIEYPEAVPDCFNIGLLHTSLAGSAEHDTYAPCAIADLEKKGYHYWALGHIHQPEVLHKDPWIAYSGNLQGRKVNETGPRGCFLVEVNDSLQVSSHQFVPLDVVRWSHLRIDLTGVSEAAALEGLIADSFTKALREVGDRLLALRLTFTGSTELHGLLHSDLSRWQAQCRSIAGDIDPEQLWFERLKLRTTPTYDPEELAKRDDLTALVMEALARFRPDQKPAAVATLENKLPPAALDELAVLEKSSNLKDEVAAIVLHSIATSTTD
jgi:exonuclease SbcD